MSYLCCFLFFRRASRSASWRKNIQRHFSTNQKANFILVDFKSMLTTVTCLFLSEGAFAFCSDVLTLSHHHEVLGPLLLLVAGAGVWVQLCTLFDKFLPICASRLQE